MSGTPRWQALSPAETASQLGVRPDHGLTPEEVETARQGFGAATNQQIARAVQIPPDQWGLATQERLALARYIADRRDVLFA